MQQRFAEKVYSLPAIVIRQTKERQVKVEVLYVADCPSRPAAVKLVRDVLAAEGISAHVHEILVSDERTAGKLKFLGSPTIRINGRDVAGDQKTDRFGLICRLHPASKQAGLPPSEMIHHAVIEGRQDTT